MRGSERTEKPTDSRRSKGRRKTRELQQTADRNQIQTLFVSRYRELAADHTQATGTGSRRANGTGRQITGVADQTYLTVKDFMRDDRAGTDVTGGVEQVQAG